MDFFKYLHMQWNTRYRKYLMYIRRIKGKNIGKNLDRVLRQLMDLHICSKVGHFK